MRPRIALSVALLPMAIGVSCRGEPAQSRSTSAAATGHAAAPASRDEWFVDATREAGLDFIHFNGMPGEYYLPEIIPPGVTFVDYDNDGDLDVSLVQGRRSEDGHSGTLHGPATPRTERKPRTRRRSHAGR